MTKEQKKEKNENNDFCKKLETVALGCHLQVNDKIKSLFKKDKIETYQCVEFILDTPLCKKSDNKNVKVFYPFLFRLINSLPFIYKIKKDKNNYPVTTDAKTKANLKNLRDEIRQPSLLKGHSMAAKAYAMWKDNPTMDFPPYKDKKKLLSNNMKRKITKGDYDSRVISNDFLLSPWLLNDKISNNSPLIVLQIPIATKVSFFGYFLIAYQDSGNNNKKIKKDIYKKLNEIIQEIYVSTLILFYVSDWEDKLNELTKDAITQNDASNWDILLQKIQKDKKSLSIKRMTSKLKADQLEKIKTIKVNQLTDELKEGIVAAFNAAITEELQSQFPYNYWKDSALNEFEAAFGKVWVRRNAVLSGNGTEDNRIQRIQKFKGTLYFHTYNIASPGMIKLIKQLINGAGQMKLPKRDGESLPAALVFGEAGSGKDIMARLIALFTDHYSSAEIVTINMAALKPNALAIPLLFGINTLNTNTLNINIDGLLSNQKDTNKVIIFDELNSLDHDLQGSLLRILENGEVWPLFSLKPNKNVKYLIIGIVNEDPEIVSREKELKELKAAEALLGKVIGSFLYKNFYSARKLRPDLMYRLKRGLYIRIPPLHERREDIPILFDANMRKALENLSGKKNLPFEIEMDALELLRREDIDWPGNIRQLEAVTKDIASEAYEEYKKNNSTNEVEIVSSIVKKVLKKNFLINDPT